MKKWTLNSWKNYPAKHLPNYADQKELDLVLSKIKSYPPLVFAGETRSLKKALAQVVEGKAFLLQGGDCAESFAEFQPNNIRDTLKAILQMSLVLTYSASLPVVKVGRIAGQFSKPRSAPTEKKDGKELPSYLGDNINGMEFTEKARQPDAKRLFRSYSQSASTLNLLRAFSQGGFADLRQVHLWNLGFINEKTKGKYKEIEDKISDALAFMEACGINPDTNRKLRTVNFYTSHEALLLPFEEAMTRVDSTTGEYHDTSAHFVWIGDRTRQPDGAHVEFCRGIKNPIGLKCGPSLKPDELIKLCNILNPDNEPGRLTLISRFGVESTVVDVTGKIKILRPGAINSIDINRIIGKKISFSRGGKKIKSPGNLGRHYSPGIPVVLNAKKKLKGCAFIVLGKVRKNDKDTFSLSLNANLSEAAKNLYKTLRKIKKLDYKKICVMKIPNKRLGIAINDRLKRAAIK